MPAAVVFDLDGTLTVRNLDFDAIRAEIGLPAGPILETLETLSAGARAAAESILNRHERHAAESASLHHGAAETIRELRRRDHPVAILTRNARRWSQRVLERFGIEVDALRCREDGPVKPHPDGLLALCRRFEAEPAQSWMVGDYLFDIQTGRRAGLHTALMIGDAEPPDFADQADHVIRRLSQILDLVDPPQTP